MPLHKGTTPAVVSANISELHHGPQFQRTAAKFGDKTAHKQAIAIALDQKRKSQKKGSGSDELWKFKGEFLRNESRPQATEGGP